MSTENTFILNKLPELPEKKWFTKSKTLILGNKYSEEIKTKVSELIDQRLVEWKTLLQEYQMSSEIVAYTNQRLKSNPSGIVDQDILIEYLAESIILITILSQISFTEQL